MILEFNINNPPPVLTEIEDALKQVIKDRALLRRKNIRFLIYVLLVVAAYATFMLTVTIPILEDPAALPDFVATVAYCTPYLTFFIFIVSNNLHTKVIERPRKILDTAIPAFKAASKKRIAEIRDCGRRYLEVANYQQRVSSIGRPMMHGETEMLFQWVEKRMQKEAGLSNGFSI
ncbi:hypothetical protein MNBD_GAMMA17-1016 [hydrothermal vent metagenome]|uniref:Uncharacterized protein n=1 Tax=hydrothermal vent metagenome TaxID=652676 RepID=A0A3B0Z756_9ZZZZ